MHACDLGVCKLPIHAKGAQCNLIERDRWRERWPLGLAEWLCPVLACAEDGSWIVMQRADVAGVETVTSAQTRSPLNSTLRTDQDVILELSIARAADAAILRINHNIPIIIEVPKPTWDWDAAAFVGFGHGRTTDLERWLHYAAVFGDRITSVGSGP